MWFIILYYVLLNFFIFGLPAIIFLFANRMKFISFLLGGLCLLFSCYLVHLLSAESGDTPGGSFGLGIGYTIFLITVVNGVAFIVGGFRKQKLFVRT